MFYLTIGVLIFIVTFYFIITEKISSAWATMLGGLVMALIGILNEEQALKAIYERLEILLLLIGMMMMVYIISETGVFQWFAIKVAQFTKGEPFRLIVMLSLITALCSAFLDNVTTILLMAPISILLANELRIDPFPFVMTEIMSANIGGLATLIGDPTQLIIGSEGELGFNAFLTNTAPMAIISMIILLGNVYFFYCRKMHISRDLKIRIMEIDSSRSLKDIEVLKVSMIIFSMVLIGFVLNNFINKGLAIIALSGAIFLVVLTKKEPKEILVNVEWETLFFFIGLFMMITGIENLHIIDFIGNKLADFTKGNFKLALISITWLSGMFTSVIGNVANAATVSKIVNVMLPTFQGQDNLNALWWALSFGSCLGGNLTILASATNVVAVAASKKAGCKIDFVKFLKFGASISIQTLLVATIYLLVRYN